MSMNHAIRIVGVATIALAVQATQPRAALAQAAPPAQASITGDVWATVGGKVVKAAGATVYVWPQQPQVTSVMDSACAASKADTVAWLAARRALNRADASAGASAPVMHNIGILRAMGELPHASIAADSAGHFSFASIPDGAYLIEAESTLEGRIVQWWKPVVVTRLLKSDASVLGPAEFHSSQFCTAPEPQAATAAAAASASGGLPSAADHVYEVGETVDKNAEITSMAKPPAAPQRSRRSRGGGSTSGTSGDVTLSFIVDAKGKLEVNSVRVVQTSDPQLNPVAERTLLTARFTPAEVGGKPVRQRLTTTITSSVEQR